MLEKENEYDFTNIIVIKTFIIISIVLFLIYSTIILTYLIKNFHTKKLCVFWFDYLSLIIIVLIFNIIYFINIICNDSRINNLLDLSKSFFSNAIILSFTTIILAIIGSLFSDAIRSIKLSSKMNEINKIKAIDFIEVSQKLKDIKINNILKIRYNYIYYIIFSIISIASIVICFFAYRDININRFEGYLNLYSYFAYFLRYYHLFAFIFFIIAIIIMNKRKKDLLNKKYFNPNRIAQKIYNAHYYQMIYFSDVITFKVVSNLIINMPVLLFLSLEKYNTFTFIISDISVFLFTFIAGSEYFFIDQENINGKLNEIINFFFCFRKLNFHFVNKDQRANFDEFMLNLYYSEDDDNGLDDLSMNAIRNIESIFLDFNENESDGSILELSNTKSLNSIRTNSNSLEITPKYIDFQTIPEFYLIQKLIMLYFITNKNVYESAMDTIEDNFLEIKKFGNERKSKRISKVIQNRDSIIANIDRISKISIKDSQKLRPSIKYLQNEIFTSIEEKELFDELKNKLNIKNEKYYYKIESILSNKLLEIIPFFQMSLNNIIKSLNPARNIKIFNKFINRNNNSQNNFQILNKDNRISVRSFKSNNNDNFNEKDNKKEFENNLFYTHDLYLMYEIYDKNDFPSFNEIENIINEYNEYLSSAIKNLNYSFLPLILGIFSLEIYDSNKIIILYRNPLYFTNFYKFNHWINFYITEEPEKIKVSSLFNDVIDVNEIEIKNTLELNGADYEEVRKSLKNDYSFLKKVNDIYPIIHLFIGDENNNGDITNIREKRNRNLFNENSILGELSSDNNDFGIFDVLDNNLSMFNINNNNDDYNDTSQNSLFDKEYYFMNGNDIRTIKIYFTNLFRKECELNKIQGNKYNKVDTDSYCKYLQDQLINYINKNTLFNEDEKNDEENKDNI